MSECKLRGVRFLLNDGWRADCMCGFTTGEKPSFGDAMEAIEIHWNHVRTAEAFACPKV
jgi:hypothetical protein